MASHREDNRQGRQLDILTDEQNAPALSSRAWGTELIGLASVNEAGEWAGFPYRDNDLSAPYREWANHALSWVIICIGSKMVRARTGVAKSKVARTAFFAPKRGTLRDRRSTRAPH